MEQHTNRILSDRCCHLIEHIETGKLVLNYRILATICLQGNTLTKLCHVVQVCHPFLVDDLQQYDTLDLTEMLWLWELRFLRFVYLGCFFLDSLLELIQLARFLLLLCQLNWLHRNNRNQKLVQLANLPLTWSKVSRTRLINITLNRILNKLEDYITHILAIQYTATLCVNNFTLVIVDLIVFHQILTDCEVVTFDLHLCFLYELGDCLMLDLLALWNLQCIVNCLYLLGTEQTHQIVVQRQIELGFTRITLTSGTTTQLVINSTGLMTLCTDDLQTTEFCHALAKLDIGTTTSHVGCDRNCTTLSGIGNDLSL